jgi:membrane protein DedA with SNARE-associated domain
MESLLHTVLTWASQPHAWPAFVVGTFFFGETVILAGIVLAASGAVPVPVLFGLCLAGTLSSDLVWFYCGHRLVGVARRWSGLHAKYEATMATLERFDGERRFYYLLFYKFVYGIRIVTIIYTSLRRIHVRRFMLFDAIGSASYLAVLIGVGLMLCHGATQLAPAMQNFRYLLAAPVVLFILSRMGTQWLRKRLFDA